MSDIFSVVVNPLNKYSNGAQVVADNALHAGEPGSGKVLEIGDYEDYFVLANSLGLQVVFSGPCLYYGYEILGAAGGGTVSIYDSVTAAGQKVVPDFTIAAAAEKIRTRGKRCLNGIAVNVITAAPTAGLVKILYKALGG